MRIFLFVLTVCCGAGVWAEDCGSNYMLPGSRAPLENQVFQVLAADGAHHIIADHLVGPPPHNYQYILRIKLGEEQMSAYRKLEKEAKEPVVLTLPAFCPEQAKAFWGEFKDSSEKLDKLFPMTGTLGTAEIKIAREDVELMVFRYLPGLLSQEEFRKALVERRKEVLPRINNAPLFASDSTESSSRRSSYISSDGMINKGELCSDKLPKTLHTFLILSELGPNSVLAVHYLDQAPHNYQTAVRLRLSSKEMRIYRGATRDTKVPPVMQTRILPRRNFYFCMVDLPKLLKAKRFDFRAQVFRASTLDDYHLGKRIGVLDIMGSEIKIISHRPVADLQNLIVVAKEVLGADMDRPAGFVDVSQAIPNLQVEMRYATDWNFMGKAAAGYEANICYLTNEAAAALSKVQGYLEIMGYSLLVFDCYRPQRAVNEFIKWTRDSKDTKMREVFYPDEPKETLIRRGYIDEKSGHSRGSTVDLTMIVKSLAGQDAPKVLRFQEEKGDCRNPSLVEKSGQVNMGTFFDCFSEASNTVSPKVPREASINRQILQAAMFKFGFVNYPKEWWHFTLRNEPFKKQYFDFVVK